jgi:hypothetical protein
MKSIENISIWSTLFGITIYIQDYLSGIFIDRIINARIIFINISTFRS